LAPVLDFYIRTSGVIGSCAFYKEILRIHPPMMHQRHGLLFQLGKWRKKVGKLHLKLIAHNEINPVGASKRFKAGLGVTPRYRHKSLRGMTKDLANYSSAIYLRPFRDRAGIDDEYIGCLAKFYRDKPAPLKPVFE
jgi:hypothetical protein